MSIAAQESTEWIDGFLFVANRLILDFLNTRPVLAGVPTELLSDVRALERWLIASGMVTSGKDKATMRGWRESAEAEALLKQLIAFRERLRENVVQMEGGELPGEEFVSEVNALLRQHPQITMIRKKNGTLARETSVELRKPADLLTPIVDATADLLVEADWSRVRQCESCVVYFLDTSKKGSRRWCSMNICGNKLKVAAYQQRRRAKDLV